jgi:hypothetical protein
MKRAMMEGTKTVRRRRRLSEQAWRELMNRFDGASMTIGEFCSREGLSRSSFCLWRSRLRSTQQSSVSTTAAATVDRATSKTPFVDLGVLGAARVSGHAALDLRIELGGGLSLHLVRR